jgi:hypothetical protein
MATRIGAATVKVCGGRGSNLIVGCDPVPDGGTGGSAGGGEDDPLGGEVDGLGLMGWTTMPRSFSAIVSVRAFGATQSTLNCRPWAVQSDRTSGVRARPLTALSPLRAAMGSAPRSAIAGIVVRIHPIAATAQAAGSKREPKEFRLFIIFPFSLSARRMGHLTGSVFAPQFIRMMAIVALAG